MRTEKCYNEARIVTRCHADAAVIFLIIQQSNCWNSILDQTPYINIPSSFPLLSPSKQKKQRNNTTLREELNRRVWKNNFSSKMIIDEGKMREFIENLGIISLEFINVDRICFAKRDVNTANDFEVIKKGRRWGRTRSCHSRINLAPSNLFLAWAWNDLRGVK